MKLGNQVVRTGLLASVALTAASVVAFAAPANAQVTQASKPAPHKEVPKGFVVPLNAACGRAGPNLDTGSGHAVNGPARIRNGSSTSCPALAQTQGNETLAYFCWTLGNDGFTWSYLHDSVVNKTGWVRDDLLSANSDGVRGSTVFCGF
jgi:hypothetical protein